MVAKTRAQTQAKYRETKALKGVKEVRFYIAEPLANQLKEAIENGLDIEAVIKNVLVTRSISRSKAKVTRSSSPISESEGARIIEYASKGNSIENLSKLFGKSEEVISEYINR